MTQKPSPCRFVLYHFLDGPWYPAGSTTPEYKITTRPAVVTSVCESDPEGMTVNLHVFFEPNDTEFHPTSAPVKTAIKEEKLDQGDRGSRKGRVVSQAPQAAQAPALTRTLAEVDADLRAVERRTAACHVRCV